MSKPPQDALTIFGKAFLKVLENPTSMALMKLLLGEAFRQPGVAEIINKIGPSRSISFLTRYLAKQMSLGVMKPMNPAAAARCFVGPFVAYMLTRELFQQPDAQQISSDTMVATAVEIFLQGMVSISVEIPDSDSYRRAATGADIISHSVPQGVFDLNENGYNQA